MKSALVISATLHLAITSAQEFPKTNACVELRKVNHSMVNRKWEQAKRASNRHNRPYIVYSLDTLGRIIEKDSYRDERDKDLQLLKNVELNTYENGRLTLTTEFVFGSQQTPIPEFKTKYDYNDQGQITKERILFYGNDSLFMAFRYQYDSNGNRIKTFLEPDSTHYNRVFDDQSKLIAIQQFYGNRMRWEWNYTYTDTLRVGKFQTYYDDPHNYTETELTIYKNKKPVEIQDQKTYLDGDGDTDQTIIKYNKSGIIDSVKYYQAFANETTFELQRFTTVQVKSCQILTKRLLARINELILNDE